MGNILVPNWTWGKGDQENCNIYANYRRPAKGFFGTDLINGYEGIPQNLVINVSGWLFLVGLFAVLRKKAWNYGRMAVMQKNEMKWADMFYGGTDGDDESMTFDEQGNQLVNPNPTTTPLVLGITRDTPIEAISKATQSPNNEDPRQSSNSKTPKISEIMDHGYFTWIKITLKLTDQDYRDKCGPDCLYYLSFQRHLIVLAGIITACSLTIVLPLNMLKSWEEFDKIDPIRNKTRKAEFSDTSIINLEERHNYLWAHVLLAIAFLLISVALMRHFSKQLRIVDDEDSGELNHTIMIIGLNRKNCKDSILREHLGEIYPNAEVTEISFAYDISKLQHMEFKRRGAASAKLYCEEQLEKTKHRPKIRPYACGVVGCGCRACVETDAIEYYGKVEKKLKEEMEVERERAIVYPLGIAFVTFATSECASAVVDEYAWSAKACLNPPKSKHAKALNSRHWIVRHAPLPEDILWANLSLDYKMWYVKCLGVNIILLVVVAVCTTPVWIMSTLSGPQNGSIPGAGNLAASELPFLAGIIVDTLPTMMICVIGVGLISLVSQSDTFVRYWTKTAGNLSEMLKIFIFLTFMVIALPSLGVTSLSYIVHRQKTVRWSCIFYKENGVLFVNYVCTSTFCGTAAELLRMPELFMYAIKLCFARSAAEVGSVRKSVLWDFQIGANYAWMLLHFAIFTCFSVIYPLVTPFGLAYLVFKHFVDRYNIYFVYAPCKVDKSVHATAVNLVMMCMFMLQINLMTYIHFHIGHQEDPTATIKPDVRALQLVALIGFCVTTALFLGQMCFNVCADFSPIHHFRSLTDKKEMDEEQKLLPHDGVAVAQTASNERVGAVYTSNILLMPEQSEVKTPKPILPEIVIQSDHIDSPQDHRKVSIGSSANSGSSEGRFIGRYIPPLLRAELIKLHNSTRFRSTDDVVLETNSKELITTISDEGLGDRLPFNEVLSNNPPDPPPLMMVKAKTQQNKH